MKRMLIAVLMCVAGISVGAEAPIDGAAAQQAASLPNPAAAAQDGKPAKTDPAVAPALIVSAIQAVKAKGSCRAIVTAGTVKLAVPQGAAADDCNDNKLVGAGDVVVHMPAAVYRAAIAHEASSSQRLNVFFNGFIVSKDAERLSAEQVGDHVELLYHLKPGAQSREFWSAIIRDGDMTGAVPLRVGYGWSEKGADSTFSSAFNSKPTVAVSTSRDLRIALSIVALCLAAAVLFAVKTGVLRDAVHPNLAPLLPQAQQLYVSLRATGADAPALKRRVLPEFGTGVIDDASCKDAALGALELPCNIADVDRPAVIVGLAGLASAPKSIPGTMSFSLARVQLFAWFLFALLAGVFLKFVYSELPKLDDSILTLLGISAGTAGLSWTIDKSCTQGAATRSRGFFMDLVTGPDNDHHVHRFQAVLVNIALLIIGIVHIVTSIAYPTFDQSWLIFLGISGATYATGKQLVEKPKTT